jgi:hypothetical protein
VTVNFWFETFVMLFVTFVLLAVIDDMLRYCVPD